MPTSFEIRRPYGGAVAGTGSGIFIPKLSGQRIGGNPPPMYYTHWVIVAPGIDIRDGSTRVAGTNQLAFGFGDELRIPGGNTPRLRFVVVYVEMATGATTKRVYVTRDVVDWTQANAINL